MTAPVGNPQFITPEGHSLFLAKKLFDGMGRIKWGALAYIEPGGGGPEGGHTHHRKAIFLSWWKGKWWCWQTACPIRCARMKCFL